MSHKGICAKTMSDLSPKCAPGTPRMQGGWGGSRRGHKMRSEEEWGPHEASPSKDSGFYSERHVKPLQGFKQREIQSLLNFKITALAAVLQ